MIRFFNIIITISYIYSSSLSFNGFGAENTRIDPGAAGLGHSILFSGRPDGVVKTAMATQYNSPLAKIFISNNYNQLSILNITSSNHYISSIGFSFPFRKLHHLVIGLSPKTRTDFSIYQHDFEHSESMSWNTDVNPLAIKRSYEFSGGISNFYFGFSSGYFDKVDVGFKWDILFGNLFSDVITDTYTFDYDNENCVPNPDGNYANDACINLNSNSSLISNNTYNFNGHSFTLDARSKFNLHELAAAISINGPLKVNKSIINNSYPGLNSVEFMDGFSIGNFSCGYKFESLNGIGSIVEVNKNFSSYNSYRHQLFQIKEPISLSINGGIFNNFHNTRIGFWNSLTLRAGFMLKQINFDGYSVQDNVVTIGLGIIFLNNTNELDISLSSGIRQTENQIYPDENYINLNFGVSSGDTWFKKIRRK